MLLVRLSIGLALFAGQIFALTTISDNLHKTDGTPCTGNLNITWASFFTPGGQNVSAGTVVVPVGVQAPGNFIALLQPGGTYSVAFSLASGCTQASQTWITICDTTNVLNMAAAEAGSCTPLAAPPVGILATIQDNLMKADGTPCTGAITISWLGFTSPLGQIVPPGNVVIPVGVPAPGEFIAQLQAGTYTVVFNLQSGCSMTTQTWIICSTSGTLTMQQAQAGICTFPSFALPESGLIWTIPGGVHGLGCAILVFPYDTAGNLMNWPAIKVAPAPDCTVTVRFGQPVVGILALIGGGQAFPFTATNAPTVALSQHGIQAPGILVGAYDAAGNLGDGEPNVDPKTYLVTDAFGTTQSGNLVLIGPGASFSFAAVTTTTVTQPQHTFRTSILFPAALDVAGNLLDPLINVNASTFAVTSTFASKNSGTTVVLQ